MGDHFIMLLHYKKTDLSLGNCHAFSLLSSSIRRTSAEHEHIIYLSKTIGELNSIDVRVDGRRNLMKSPGSQNDGAVL